MKNNSREAERLMAEFWDKRFANAEYVCGKEPNAFFKSVIDTLKPGKIFIPGAGEGRDAVYAANKEWEVYCVDISGEGRTKARKPAIEKKAKIFYDINNINNVIFAYLFTMDTTMYAMYLADTRFGRYAHRSRRS